MSSTHTTKVKGCLICSGTKNPKSHTYGKYKVIETKKLISLRCSTCSHIYTYPKKNEIITELQEKIEKLDNIIYNQAEILDYLEMMKDE